MSMPAGSRTDKGLGFGLGFAVRMMANPDNPYTVAGEYFWAGAASTAFVICPRMKRRSSS